MPINKCWQSVNIIIYFKNIYIKRCKNKYLISTLKISTSFGTCAHWIICTSKLFLGGFWFRKLFTEVMCYDFSRRSFINKISVSPECCSTWVSFFALLSMRKTLSTCQLKLLTLQHHCCGLSAFVTSTLAAGPASLYSERTDWSNRTLTAEKQFRWKLFWMVLQDFRLGILASQLPRNPICILNRQQIS